MRVSTQLPAFLSGSSGALGRWEGEACIGHRSRTAPRLTPPKSRISAGFQVPGSVAFGFVTMRLLFPMQNHALLYIGTRLQIVGSRVPGRSFHPLRKKKKKLPSVGICLRQLASRPFSFPRLILRRGSASKGVAVNITRSLFTSLEGKKKGTRSHVSRPREAGDRGTTGAVRARTGAGDPRRTLPRPDGAG